MLPNRYLINQKKEKKTDENLFICKIFLQLIMSTKWIWLLLLRSVLGNFNALTLHTTENCSWYTVTVNYFSIQPAYKYHKFQIPPGQRVSNNVYQTTFFFETKCSLHNIL